MRILGVDPGSRYTGYGIIDMTQNRLRHVHSGRIEAIKVEGLPQRLLMIYRELSRVIEEHQPQAFALEKIFHSVNPQSSLILGHARGAAMLACAEAGLEFFDYSPTEVKNAVVGQGRASKAQVAGMVTILLGLQGSTLAEDEADALAVAICHAHTVPPQQIAGAKS